jgi:hypothetical protein
MPEFATTPIPYVPISEQAVAVRAAIDAARLSNDNSFGGLQRLAIPGPFASDVEANTNGVPDDNLYYRSDGTVRAASHLSLDLAFALDKTLTARIGPTPTFERASGGTYVGSDKLIHGIDTSASSNSISIASKTFTLDAPLGQDQMWRVGDVVAASDASNAANFMVGTVTSYTASTQVLVCNMTIIGGTGTFTSWRVAYRGPRFDHDPSTGECKGLLIEEQRSNLVVNSNFATWFSGTGAHTVTENSTDVGVAPDGTLPTKVECTTSGNFQKSFGASNGVTYAQSIYARVLSGTQDLRIGGVVSGGLTTHTATDQWGRYANVGTAIATGTRFIFLTMNAGEVLYLWGPQVEAGPFPTSYIPTTTVGTVRSADVCSITGPAFSGFYNQSEGTVLTESSTRSPGNSVIIFAFSDGTISNVIQSLPGTASFAVISGGSSQASLDNGTFVTNTASKLAGTYKINDFASAKNGGAVASDTLGIIPTVSRLGIGSRNDAVQLNGHIASLRYYKKRLTNEKLQSLTAP